MVAAHARSCRECGASDDSGWGPDDYETPMGSDDEFDYDEFVDREFPDDAKPGSPGLMRRQLVYCVMGVVLLGFLLGLFGSL